MPQSKPVNPPEIPCYCEHAERAAILSCLFEPKIAEIAFSTLTDDDFHMPYYRNIWPELRSYFATNKNIDEYDFLAHLKKKGVLHRLDAKDGLHRLFSDAASRYSGNIEKEIEILKFYTRRRTIKKALLAGIGHFKAGRDDPMIAALKQITTMQPFARVEKRMAVGDSKSSALTKTT